jgi:hypothetical protein
MSVMLTHSSVKHQFIISFRELFLAAYLGVFVFSRFAAFLTIELFNLNIYLPEIFFIPLIFFAPKSWFKIFTIGENFKLVFFGTSFFIVLILLTGIFNSYGIISALGAIRGYLYVFVFFMIGLNIRRVDLVFIFWICVFSTAISFIWLIVFPLQDDEVYYVSLNCIFLAIGLSYFLNFKVLHVCLLGMSVYISIFSALRRVFFVVLIFYVILLIVYLLKKDLKFIFLIVLFMGLFLAYEKLLDFLGSVTSNNDWLYERIYLKTLFLLEEGGARGDFNRIGMIDEFFSNSKLNIFPKGFLTKNSNVTGDGSYMDLPLSEIFYTFGAPLAIFFILSIIIRTLYLLRRSKSKANGIYQIIPTFAMLIFAFLFFDGGFLIWQYNTIFTGFFLGVLFNSRIY